jgi:tetratricopeptide (TPR) repeat protein
VTPLEQAERAAEKGDWRSAAVHYETAGEPNQALDCYDKAGEFLKAALAYERQILGSGVDYRLLSEDKRAKLEQICMRASGCFEKAAELIQEMLAVQGLEGNRAS